MTFNASPLYLQKELKRIIIVGFMGCGKTTVGHALSKGMGWMYYDLDWYIETRRHKSIAQLFAEEGEECFRKIEHNMLHEVAEFEQVVISCGGGTPCFYDNMSYMNQQGLTIYLKATADVLYEHLKTARVERPLWHGTDEKQRYKTLKRMLAEREPYYMQAQHVFDIDNCDNHQDINTIINRISELLNN